MKQYAAEQRFTPPGPVNPPVTWPPSTFSGPVNPRFAHSFDRIRIGPDPFMLPIMRMLFAETNGSTNQPERPYFGVDGSAGWTADMGSSNPQTYDFNAALVYRDAHLWSPKIFGEHVDVLNEPSLFFQRSYGMPTGINQPMLGPLQSSQVGVGVSALNYDFINAHDEKLGSASFPVTFGIDPVSKLVAASIGGSAAVNLNRLAPNFFNPGTALTGTVALSDVLPFGKRQAGVQYGWQQPTFSLALTMQLANFKHWRRGR